MDNQQNQQILMDAIADLKRDVRETKGATEAFRNAFSLKFDSLQKDVHVIDKNVTALQTRNVEEEIKSLFDKLEKLEARINALEDTLMYFKGAFAVVGLLYGFLIALLFWWLGQK